MYSTNCKLIDYYVCALFKQFHKRIVEFCSRKVAVLRVYAVCGQFQVIVTIW